MPTTGRRARWAMPVFAPIATKSKIATPVVSLPVPAVVGTAIERLQRPGHGFGSTDRRVHVREQIGRIRRVEVRGLGRVHHRAAADGDVAVELPGARELDGFLK